MVLPTVDEFAARVFALGRGALMFKVDLQRACRQIYVNPVDVPLLGFWWDESFYFDQVLPMGMRSSAYICQWVTSALVALHAAAGFDLRNYIDDLASAEAAERARRSFDLLINNLTRLRIVESQQTTPPTNLHGILGGRLRFRNLDDFRH